MSDIEISRPAIRPVSNMPDTRDCSVLVRVVRADGSVDTKRIKVRQNFAHVDAKAELKQNLKALILEFRDNVAPDDVLRTTITELMTNMTK